MDSVVVDVPWQDSFERLVAAEQLDRPDPVVEFVVSGRSGHDHRGHRLQDRPIR